MKKIVLILITTLAISLSSFATIITISKANKGAEGYANVDEYHDETGSSLTCSEPGSIDCSLSIPPAIPNSVYPALTSLAQQTCE